MKKSIVAIVGRPNVGKSTLFNKLAGHRISIVEDTPGVTRDRIYYDTDWAGKHFTIIDTGGLEPKKDDIILKQMFRQANMAIDSADVIIFLVDIRVGVTEDDIHIANILKKSKKPILLVVNKVDNLKNIPYEIYDFYSLGIKEVVPISAGQALGIGDMLDELVKYFEHSEDDQDDDSIKVAVVGKPNVGKSSLINKILGQERLIVSNVPGTTRDAIDTLITKDNKSYKLIDTAGIRKKSKIKDYIEKYSVVRSIAAIERCDVCILMIDAQEKITEQDTKIAGLAHESGKAIIVAVNKWDLLEKDNKTMQNYLKDIEKDLLFMQYSQKIFISSLTGQRVHKLFEYIDKAYENSSKRISTGILNDVIIEAVSMNEPPNDKGKRLKIYYATQASTKPPTFILFVNDQKLMHFSYKRYIENQVRLAFGFEGTPIHFILRNKN